MITSSRESGFSELADAAAYLMKHTGTPDLFERLLRIVAKQLKCTAVRVDYQDAGRNEVRLVHADRISERLARRFNDGYLGPLANSALIGELSSATLQHHEKEGQNLSLICAPITNSDQVIGAVTAMTVVSDETQVNSMLSRVDGLAALASAASASLEARTATTEPSSPPPAPAGVANAKAIAETAHFESPDEFAYSLVNQLSAQLKAETVALGMENRGRMNVLAVSGVSELKAKTPGVTRFTQLMEECLDRNEPVVGQSAQTEELTALPIHRQHSTESQNASICSIPLMYGEQVGGVVTIQRSADLPFKPEEISHLAKALAPYGNALKVLESANRSLPRHFMDSGRSAIRRNLVGWRLLCLTLVGALIAWVCLGTLTYRPLCQTRIVAAGLRHFSAPFGGKLKQVPVSPGQFVRRGQVLAVFDTTDLRLQLNSLRRNIQAKEIEKTYAIDNDDLPKAALHRAEIAALRARLDAVEQQIREAKITAPVDGNVVLSDLPQRVGQVFQQGDRLLQVAPQGDWMLEIQVPDDVISYVAPKQSGSFATLALPTHRQPFEIEHIDAAAQVIDDENVFVARARLTNRPDWMRSGMEGTAQIEAVDRPVWWVCFHTAIDWVQTNFWL